MILPSYSYWLYFVFILKCASIISDPCKKVEERKVQKKRVEKTKSCEKKVKDQFVYKCTSVEVFIELHTRLLSLLWCKIFLRFDCNTCNLSIILVCIKSEISLRVCLIYLHRSYLVVSTKQRTSSLDCYLTLQQLDFRLHSLCITPYQAPHTSHHNRYSLVLYSPSHHFRYHHTLFFL